MKESKKYEWLVSKSKSFISKLKDDIVPSEDEEVAAFIINFVTNRGNSSNSSSIMKRISFFEDGFCYAFASILKETFNRGEIVWVAPFAYIAWADVDGNKYDINGLLEEDSAFYWIPVKFMGEELTIFKHIRITIAI